MTLSRRLGAEGLGSLLLAATVIGSGIMAERLASGNTAVAAAANTGATVAVLAVLIALFGAGQRRALQPRAAHRVQLCARSCPGRRRGPTSWSRIAGCWCSVRSWLMPCSNCHCCSRLIM